MRPAFALSAPRFELRRGRAVIGAAAVLLALVSLMLAAQTVPAPGDNSRFTLSLIATNDLHGGILPVNGRGGLALLGGYVGNLRNARARDGGAVLLIDAGDMWQGTLESNFSEGASVVSAYNALGYAAAAIGNHEFDFGPVGPGTTVPNPNADPRGALKARAAEATFPFLAANLIDQSTNRPVAWPNVRPSVIVKAKGVNVGVIGILSAGALSATGAANVAGLKMAPLADRVIEEARALRAQGATIVLVASHAGGRCTRFDNPKDLSSCDNASEVFKLARALPAGLVNVILAGHVHQGIAHEVNGIPITSAYMGGSAFSRVDLTVDAATGRAVAHRIFAPHDICARENPRTGSCVTTATTNSRPAQYESAAVEPDERIARVLAPSVQQVARLKATSLGVTLETPLRRAGKESALGNLVTDAMLAAMQPADVAVNNTDGGLRADLPRGAVTYGALYAVLPFDNRLLRLTMTGAQLKSAVSQYVQRRADNVGVSGVRIRVACAGNRVAVTLTRDSGVLVRDDERLVVATTDFLATGGADLMRDVNIVIPADAPLQREVVADWFRQRGGTLREDQLIDRNRPRTQLPGPLPIRCK